MTALFMLDDMEPWPDDPAPGVLCTPTTYWASPPEFGLPSEVTSEIDASIVAVDTDQGVERIAHLGSGFTTLVGTGNAPTGVTVLTGCLVWDRYLWMDYRTPPTGRIRVLDLAGYVVQQVRRLAKAHPGWTVPEPQGPLEFRRIYTGTDVVVRWRVWRAELIKNRA